MPRRVTVVVVTAMFYETLVKQRMVDKLTNLTISQLDEARVYESDGTTKTVSVENLEAGDRVLVRKGERIPVDGTLVDEECTVDEAVITGESLPVVKRDGDAVVGGSVVTTDGAVVAVTDDASSSIDQLLTAVWDVQSADHGVQRQGNRFAASIVVVFVASILVAVGQFVLGMGPLVAALGALIVLMIGSPWALGLAMPLSVASSVEEAMRRGIVIFDETIFERLRSVDTVVFDKTGTLTTGEMYVIESDTPDELLPLVAALERRATHPAADAIVSAVEAGVAEKRTLPDGGTDDRQADSQMNRVHSFTNHSTGVQGVVDGTEVLIGTPALFEAQGWSISNNLQARVRDARGFGRLPVVVGREGQAEGMVIVGDEPRQRWDETVSELSEQGIEVIVLTGDDRDAARFFEEHSGVTHVFAEISPAGKTAAIRRLQADRYVTMVGDGTNDAPVLAQADLGISLGSGTALASDAADLTIVDDTLTSIEEAFELAHTARDRAIQNNGLALVYNGLAIPLAVFGFLNPLLVMGAVVVSTMLIVANSQRDLLDD